MIQTKTIVSDYNNIDNMTNEWICTETKLARAEGKLLNIVDLIAYHTGHEHVRCILYKFTDIPIISIPT